ncbi:MAG: hypothetical protein WKF77_22810 [Planctomycetaceae bacterium]
MDDTVAVIPERRVWMFRLISVVLGLSGFVLLELMCIAAGWGELQLGDDPLVGFESIRPLFEKTSDGRDFHTSPARRGYFKEVSFAVEKPGQEFRIFVFGGSTVQGNPFSIETSFPTYLQFALEKADSSRRWKVINCGGVSYASYRLLPVMRECLNYQPDLFVFCEGHNQFLEHISFAEVRESAAITGRAHSILSQLRSFRVLQRSLKGSAAPNLLSGTAPAAGGISATLPLEVATLLDQHNGLAKYHRDDKLTEMLIRSFAADLRSMSTLSRHHHVPLLFILPPSNLSDCPPFKSEFSASTTIADQAEIRSLLKKSRELVAGNLPRAITLLEEASRTDRRYAMTWYELGQLQLAALDFTAADASFRHAKDEDVCPLRMTTPLDAAMRNTASLESVPLIDAHELLSRRCRNGIVGDAILVDHVHPSFRGHEEIATAIADWMLSVDMASETNATWKDDAVQECRKHLLALDDLYFLRGQRALRSLRLWAAGRADEMPIAPPEHADESQASRDTTIPTESLENAPK